VGGVRNGRVLNNILLILTFLEYRWVPVWFFENWPGANVILTSYEADFAAIWGRKVRDTI
jgi:hypothetical protein